MGKAEVGVKEEEVGSLGKHNHLPNVGHLVMTILYGIIRSLFIASFETVHK